MKLTMPEELLLLMLDDRSGRLMERAAPSGDYALAGAVLAELALAGRIDTDPGHLYVTDAAPIGDPVLDAALARIAESAQPDADSRHWIEVLAGEADAWRDTLFERLVSKGVLRREEGRFLWVFPERRYPAVSGREEREVKARIMGVLFNDDIPEPRDSLMIGLCRAAGLFSLILAADELDNAEARINQVADLEELNRSLSEAIREIYSQIARYAPMI